MKSLDPRVARLPETGTPGRLEPKPPLDQWGTYEVFVQPRHGKPFQHEGIVHAPDTEMAYILAKEAFTRRFTCVSLYVTDTRNVLASPTTDGATCAYNLVEGNGTNAAATISFEIYHLARRGKQHVHAGTVLAGTEADALRVARQQLRPDKPVYNVWAIRTDHIRFTKPEEQDLWLTLPEKTFRDAATYKGGDKLKDFLERNGMKENP